MTLGARPAPDAPERVVTETALPPILLLSAALLASWSAWVLLVYPRLPQPPPGLETVVSILARTVFWLAPCGIYLWRYWGRRWHEPLGLGFPLGQIQILRTLTLTVVVTILFFAGTALQLHVAFGTLFARFVESARFELTAPVFEELVFRGLVLGEFINWARDSSASPLELRVKFWAIMILAAVVFVLVHWPWWASHYGLAATLVRSPPVLLTGLVLGFVFATTRSLWACIFVHWLNNQLSLVG